MNKRQEKLKVALATYTPQEYVRLHATADDASELDATWEEWFKGVEEARSRLALQGIECVNVPIEIAALQQFCLEHNLKNTGETRANYAAEMLRKQHQQPSKKLKKKRKK
jgi:hypothetical protein